MAVDIIIALLLLIAFLIGYQRGLIQPLFAEAFAVIFLVEVFSHRTRFASIMAHFPGGIVTTVLAAVLGAVVASMVGGFIGARLRGLPGLRGVDGLLGVVVNVFAAVLVVYLALSTIVVLGHAFSATVGAAKLTTKQVSSMSDTLRS
ncbi:MAG TPA: CvpA family protein, partial [Chloroflexota bacterium]|nr:CvpA family protein [Chloroflexota bacterium]